MANAKPDRITRQLSPDQKAVLLDGGTEAPGSGKYVNFYGSGQYHCAACGQLLFKSESKFESTMPGLIGWPAFSELASNDAVELIPDNSHGMERTEIVCSNCGSHLGHLFENDPSSATGQHYCVNSIALDFESKK